MEKDALSVSGIDSGCDASLGSAGPVVPADEAWVVGWSLQLGRLSNSPTSWFFCSVCHRKHNHTHTRMCTHTYTHARTHRYSKTQTQTWTLKCIPIVTSWFQTLTVMWILNRACFRWMWFYQIIRLFEDHLSLLARLHYDRVLDRWDDVANSKSGGKCQI